MRKLMSLVAMIVTLAAAPVAGEVELSLYGGMQTLPHSRVTGFHPLTGAFSKRIGWKGKSLDAPAYYGARAVWWRSPEFGWGIEMTHAKAYAPAAQMVPQFNRLEFTDGHNIVTLNAHRRWQGAWADGAMTPYVSAGLGIALPHVDVRPVGGLRTYGYQLTGPAARLSAGVSYRINDRWNLFGEYQFTYSDNRARLRGGGNLSTRLITNALNFGVGFSF